VKKILKTEGVQRDKSLFPPHYSSAVKER